MLFCQSVFKYIFKHTNFLFLMHNISEHKFSKFRSHLKILATIRVIRGKIHTQDPQVLFYEAWQNHSVCRWCRSTFITILEVKVK
jgi:hypothetical protein